MPAPLARIQIVAATSRRALRDCVRDAVEAFWHPDFTSPRVYALAVAEPLALSVLEPIAGQAAVEDAETRGWIAVTGDNADPQVYLAHPIYGEVRRRRSPTTTLRRLRSAVAQALAAAWLKPPP